MHLWKLSRLPFKSSRRCFSAIPMSSMRARPRPIQLTTSTTLFYSTVMAAACAADLHMKKSRRQALDEKIAHLEQEIAHGFSSTTKIDPRQNEKDRSQERQGHSTSTFSLTEHETALKTVPEAGSITTWRPGRCLRIELAVAYTTTRLMLHLAKSLKEEQPAQGHTESIAQYKSVLADLRQRLDRLRPTKSASELGDMPSLQYPRYKEPPPGLRLWATTVNRTIRIILTRHSMQRLSEAETINRLAYTLMTSKQAPDIRTFTLLISYFSAYDNHKIAGIFADGMNLSRIGRDEIATNTLIAHTVRSNNGRAFAKNSRTTLRRCVAATTRHTKRTGYSLADKKFSFSSRDAVTYSGLICGSLRFGLYQQAYEAYQRMPWRAQPNVLTSFLWYYRTPQCKHQVPETQILPLSMKIWSAIQALKDEEHSTKRFLPNAYSHMLAICRKYGSRDDLETIEKQRMQDGVELGPRPTANEKPWFHRDRQQDRSKIRRSWRSTMLDFKAKSSGGATKWKEATFPLNRYEPVLHYTLPSMLLDDEIQAGKKAIVRPSMKKVVSHSSTDELSYAPTYTQTFAIT